MDKWEASFICVLSSVQSCHHCCSESAYSLSVWQSSDPCLSLCTKEDSNTLPNPPLTALLTQSIPCGVGCCQVAVAKLWFLWQQWLGLAVMSARCVLAVWALTRPTLVGDNEQRFCCHGNDCLSVYDWRSARGDSQLAWSVCEGEMEWVGRWDGRDFPFWFVLGYLLMSATCVIITKNMVKFVPHTAFSYAIVNDNI